jgi:hypothetical protein
MRISRILMLVCVLSSTALAEPAAAAPDPPIGAIVPPIEGYVWGWQPAAASYTSTTGYEHNSAGGAVQVTRTGVGRYTVRFVNMAGQGGVAHVSAYGGSNICTVTNWGPLVGDEFINLRCFTAAGAAADSRFVAHVSNRKDGASRGYLYSNDATAPVGGYAPSPGYSYDSTGQQIAVFGAGTGAYAVELGAFAQDIGGAWRSGALRVSAYGTAAVTCQVMDPELFLDPGVLRVRCFDTAGDPVNSRFVLSYSRAVVPVSATVDNYGAAPTAAGWSSPGIVAPVITEVDDDGDYSVAFTGAGAAGGHAFAGIMGTPPMYCTIFSWFVSGGALNLRVRCYQPGGGQLNPAVLFTVGFLT